MKIKKTWAYVLGIILLISAIAAAVIFLVPVPYTATEVYTESEPYNGKEYYEDREPYTDEECTTELPEGGMDLINRGINALLNEDADKLIETCREVTKYRTVTKSRDVVKYKTVKKERQVTKTATAFMMLTGQVKYYYEV